MYFGECFSPGVLKENEQPQSKFSCFHAVSTTKVKKNQNTFHAFPSITIIFISILMQRSNEQMQTVTTMRWGVNRVNLLQWTFWIETVCKFDLYHLQLEENSGLLLRISKPFSILSSRKCKVKILRRNINRTHQFCLIKNDWKQSETKRWDFCGKKQKTKTWKIHNLLKMSGKVYSHWQVLPFSCATFN